MRDHDVLCRGASGIIIAIDDAVEQHARPLRSDDGGGAGVCTLTTRPMQPECTYAANGIRSYARPFTASKLSDVTQRLVLVCFVYALDL